MPLIKYRKILGADRKVHWAKVIAVKQDKLSSVPRIHVIERPDLYKLFCDFTHACEAFTHSHTPLKKSQDRVWWWVTCLACTGCWVPWRWS